MWFMILMLALAGAFAASMQSNDLLLLGLAAAVGAAIGFAAYDIPRRATAAIAPGFVGGPFMRWFSGPRLRRGDGGYRALAHGRRLGAVPVGDVEIERL